VTTKSKPKYDGAKEVADQLVLNHLGIARAIALHIYSTIPVHVELDDLIHSGLIGLLDAATKYDPSKHVQFPSYARYRIRGAIFDSLRKLDVASRDLRRRLKEIETVTRELNATLRYSPTEVEIAAHMHIDIAQLRKLMLEGRGVAQVSTSFSSSDDDVLEHEFEGRPDTRPDVMFSVIQLRSVLDKAMLPLRPRQQQVVQAYYAGCKTMKEIGLFLGINESRVSQLHKSALIKMRTELVASGVPSSRAF
jgi:RNA polymerase sigma factor for flagellar operon FliA